MKTQSRIEQLLKEIHLMAEKCETSKGNANEIIMNKKALYDRLEEISKCMYDMMDEYAISQEKRAKTQRELREQGEAIVENASRKADDVYAASVLYMDDAITRLVRIFDQAQRQADEIYKEIGTSIETQRRNLRSNQNELQDQMFEMRDSNLYLNVLDDRRRKMDKAKTENQVVMGDKTKEILDALASGAVSAKGGKADIRVNPAYFEKTGKPLPEEEEKPATEEVRNKEPEIKVNLNSNYFKWKKNKEEKQEKK